MNQESATGQHIFIVEDDAVMRYILKRILSHTCLLTVFNNGQECLSALQKGVVPDLVLTDLNTPLLNGIQLIRTMKTNAELCHIPVVVMSAENSPDMILKCLSAGAFDYLQKPFQTEDLLAKIKRAIQQAEEKNCVIYM